MISRRSRNTTIAVVILLAMLLAPFVWWFVLPRFGHDTSNAFSPWAWPEDSLPPSDEQWACALACLLDNQGGGATSGVEGTSFPTRYDFQRTHGMWFCAVLSKRNDSTGFYRIIIGWLRAGNIAWREIRDPRHELQDSSMIAYLHLITVDSMWSLFGAYGSLSDDNWWDDTYDKAGWSPGSTVQVTHLIGLEGCKCYGQVATHLPAGPLPDLADSQTRVPWLQVSFWLLREAPLGRSQDIAHESVTPRQELFVHKGRHFAGIFSRRNNQVGAYVAIVGRHLGDSILYREVDEVRLLSGDDLAHYLNLVRTDSLWTMLGPLETLADEAGLERLWTQAGQRHLADSGVVLTRVLRFGSESKQ